MNVAVYRITWSVLSTFSSPSQVCSGFSPAIMLYGCLNNGEMVQRSVTHGLQPEPICGFSDDLGAPACAFQPESVSSFSFELVATTLEFECRGESQEDLTALVAHQAITASCPNDGSTYGYFVDLEILCDGSFTGIAPCARPGEDPNFCGEVGICNPFGGPPICTVAADANGMEQPLPIPDACFVEAGAADAPTPSSSPDTPTTPTSSPDTPTTGTSPGGPSVTPTSDTATHGRLHLAFIVAWVVLSFYAF